MIRLLCMSFHWPVPGSGCEYGVVGELYLVVVDRVLQVVEILVHPVLEYNDCTPDSHPETMQDVDALFVVSHPSPLGYRVQVVLLEGLLAR